MTLSAKDAARLTAYHQRVKSLKDRKNFASSSSGANVLKASQGVVNKGALLKSDDDAYSTLNECHNLRTYTMIINLSDDVQIDTILVTNHEDFSAQLGDMSFYGSIDYPP